MIVMKKFFLSKSKGIARHLLLLLLPLLSPPPPSGWEFRETWRLVPQYQTCKTAYPEGAAAASMFHSSYGHHCKHSSNTNTHVHTLTYTQAPQEHV